MCMCGNHNYHAGKSTFNFTLVLSPHQMTESCALHHLWAVEDTVFSADIKNKAAEREVQQRDGVELGSLLDSCAVYLSF